MPSKAIAHRLLEQHKPPNSLDCLVLVTTCNNMSCKTISINAESLRITELSLFSLAFNINIMFCAIVECKKSKVLQSGRCAAKCVSFVFHLCFICVTSGCNHGFVGESSAKCVSFVFHLCFICVSSVFHQGVVGEIGHWKLFG